MTTTLLFSRFISFFEVNSNRINEISEFVVDFDDTNEWHVEVISRPCLNSANSESKQNLIYTWPS